MDSKKSINSFEIENNNMHLIIYVKIIFFAKTSLARLLSGKCPQKALLSIIGHFMQCLEYPFAAQAATRVPPAFRLFFIFYEQLMISFETVFCFLIDPSDPNYCTIIGIIYEFLKLFLLMVIQ